jgi:hypothetical protein
MADEPDNLTLKQLSLIREDMRNMHEDVRDIRRRVSNIEAHGAHVEGSIAMLHGIAVQQSARLDDVADRLVRIEKRLGLIDAE